jgi:hypothetical protein
LGGVVGDVLAEAAQGSFGADDMFVVIALPKALGEGGPCRAFDAFGVSFGGQGFEALDDLR